MTDFYDNTDSFEGAGGDLRRYWPVGMSYEAWRDLPLAERERVGMVDYHPPSAQGWHGFASVLDIIRRSFADNEGERIEIADCLDIGCSTGVFLQHAIAAGIDGYGVDASRWAVANPIDGVPADRLHRMIVGADEWPVDIPDEVEMVTAFDFLEHVFEEDVDDVLTEMLARSSKYVALCICAISPSAGETPWSAKKGEWEGPDHLDDQGRPIEWARRLGARTVPEDRLWQAVSGHVTMQSPEWWHERIERAGLTIDWRAMWRFELFRRECRDFCYGIGPGVFSPRGATHAIPFPGGVVDQVASWAPRCVVLGRVDR